MTQGVVIRFERTNESAILPAKAHADDACFDLYAAEKVTLPPLQRAAVDTGFNIALPTGHAGLVCSRSGTALNYGVFVLNAPGMIDAGYRGALKVILLNSNKDIYTHVEIGDRIGQLFLQKVLPSVCVEVGGFDDNTTRGTGGFGSSGK